MQHVRETLEALRRYIAKSEARAELEEVDTLLSVALDEVRRKQAALAQAVQAVGDPTRRNNL